MMQSPFSFSDLSRMEIETMANLKDSQEVEAGEEMILSLSNKDGDQGDGSRVQLSPDGDVIDCVHVSHQPAFDHPFLKNHTVQMMPAYHPEGLYDVNKLSSGSSSKEKSRSISQLWHANGRCPEDTIPIRRTKREDVLRASSIKRFGRKKQLNLRHPMSSEPDLVNQSGHQIV